MKPEEFRADAKRPLTGEEYLKSLQDGVRRFGQLLYERVAGGDVRVCRLANRASLQVR